jgi:hypothetical protein
VSKIHFWPVGVEDLEENLLTDEEINLPYIDTRTINTIGLAAIEYLLFHEDEDATLLLFSGNESRRNYLLALTENRKLQVDLGQSEPRFHLAH